MAAFLLHYLQSICTDISRYIPLGPELSRLFSTSYYVTHQPPTRRAAGGRGRQPPGPLQPPAPAVRRNVVTRRPTGLARVARCAPKSPRVNFRQRTAF